MGLGSQSGERGCRKPGAGIFSTRIIQREGVEKQGYFGKKLSRHTERSTAKPDYSRHNLYAHGRGSPRYQHYRKPFLGSWKNDHKHPPTFKRKKAGKSA